MKTIKTYLLVLFVFSMVLPLQGQSWHIQDDVVFAEKIVLGGLLAGELILKKKQKKLIEELAGLEEILESKRGAKANLKGSKILGVNAIIIKSIKDDITEIQHNLTGLSLVRLRHGVSRYKSDIETEKKYLTEIENEQLDFIAGIVNSGGPGYYATAGMKMLIRLLKIRDRVSKINLEVNNSIVLNKIKF